MTLLILLSLASVYSQSTVTCETCNGYKALRCSGCNGGGIVYSQVWNPYYGCYQTVQQYCGYCLGHGAVVCGRCNGYGVLVVNDNYQPSFKGNLIAVSVTIPECSGFAGSLCSCTNYKGYRIAGTKTYTGNCSNMVKGHKCGHSPSAHGL